MSVDGESQRQEVTEPILRKTLLAIAIGELMLALILAAWFGFLQIGLAGLTKTVAVWVTAIGAVATLGVTLCWQLRRFRENRFRLSLRTLFLGITALSLILAFIVSPLRRAHRRNLATEAMSHVHSIGGMVTVSTGGSVDGEVTIDLTDHSTAASVWFDGVTLEEVDTVQLARIPALTSLMVTNAPIEAASLEPLRRSPGLKILVFENTGADKATLARLAGWNPQWNVFPSRDALRQWSLHRASKLLEQRAYETP